MHTTFYILLTLKPCEDALATPAAGRSTRDKIEGNPCKCVLLYSYSHSKSTVIPPNYISFYSPMISYYLAHSFSFTLLIYPCSFIPEQLYITPNGLGM